MNPVTPADKKTPVNLITGWLGAGKTTVIQHLLATRPAGERWAVLVNDFGEIGIDQAALGGEGVVVKEVPGGCICCANALPLQIALSQLLARANPSRLLIEPTGLGHPRQILSLLHSPEWSTMLAPQATVCVVDVRQMEEPRIAGDETWQAQVEVADVLLFSKSDLLTEAQRDKAKALLAGQLHAVRQSAFITQGDMPAEWLALPARQGVAVRRSLLHVAPSGAPAPAAPRDPPYHYHQQAEGRALGGWVFPPDWQFAHDALLDVLFGLTGMERVKGIFHTERGWLFYNASSADTRINSTEYRADSRLELIGSSAAEPDWALLEDRLLATRTTPQQEQAAAD